MNRTTLLRIAGVGLAALAAVGGWILMKDRILHPSPSGGGIPLILISVDTCRVDAVSGFGAPPEQTPTLLKIGDEGIRFDGAISASHVTAPSHATMLTGYSPYVHATGMSYKKASAIPKTLPTLGEILQKSGYYSAAFTDAGQMVAEAGFQHGFDIFLSDPSGLVDKLPKVEEFLTQVKGKPFFLFAHTYRAHQPYRTPKRLLQNLIKGYQGDLLEGARLAANTSIRESMTNGGKLEKLSNLLSARKIKTDDDRKFFRKLYDAAVTGADDEVAELVAVLKKHNVYENALIVVTSDHGEAFFEHGIDSHKDVYEECIRVPLIVRFPGAEHAGRRVAGQFPSVNLVPTLLDYLKIQHSYTFEGHSVARESLSGEALPPQTAFQHWLMGGDDRMPLGFGVRTMDGKWIEKDTHTPKTDSTDENKKQEYYNLQKDAGEKTNLAGKGEAGEAALREELARMREKWNAWRRQFLPNGVKLNELTDEAVEHLRQIGYIK